MRKIKDHLGNLWLQDKPRAVRQEPHFVASREHKQLKNVKQITKRVLRNLTHKELTAKGVPRHLNGNKLGLRERRKLA